MAAPRSPCSRNVWSSSCHDNPIIGRFLRITDRPITLYDRELTLKRELGQILQSKVHQFRESLNGNHVMPEIGKDGRLIAGATANFKNFQRCFSQIEQFRHQGHDVGL